MKKFGSVILSLAIGFSFVCHAMAEEITIVGTGDGVIILKAIGEAFSQNNPGITIGIPESIGSGGGVKAIGTDKYLVGRIAREIQEKEKPYGLSYLPFAKVPTVFFTNKNIEIKNLSVQQVCDIYSGKINNWKAIGGKDARIKVVTREAGDSSLNVLLSSFPGFDAITITPYSKTAFSTPETFSDVENIPDTIGFGPYDVAKNANVNMLTIEGKAPTDTGYPCLTPLSFIYKANHNTGNIRLFLDFATSPAAYEAIQKAGGIPYAIK